MKILSQLLVINLIFACNLGKFSKGESQNQNEPPYRDVTETHLPADVLGGNSMAASAADFDADGDLDIIIANEYRPNILLLNDGTGRFKDTNDRLPSSGRDSEDIGLADFDKDGDIDIIVVSEDDRVNEFYLNNGEGSFTDAGSRLNTTGTSNAIMVADFNEDGFGDVLIGNNGQNEILINNGKGSFNIQTSERLPALRDITQDLELGDIDGDGDLDIIAGNEDQRRLFRGPN